MLDFQQLDAVEENKMKFVGKNYTNCRVELDNNEFVQCRFGPGAIVAFGGHGIAKVVDCQFEGATLHFEGAAETTLSFLRTMAQSQGGLHFVNQVLDVLVFCRRPDAG